jgi:hypothetical protein
LQDLQKQLAQIRWDFLNLLTQTQA